MSLPSWREQLPQNFAGALKWGTGINPVHSIPEDGTSMGRNLAPGPYAGQRDLSIVDLPADTYISEDYCAHDDMSYTEAHPNWDERPPRAAMPGFPPWGPGGDPLPAGTALRARKVGMAWKEQMPLQVPEGPAGYGWENKISQAEPLDSGQSDTAQLYVMTSQTQLQQTKTNDAAVLRGTDDPRSGIASRIIGMQTLVWSGGERHDDMTPRTQDENHRPFVYRTAQAGPANYSEWIAVNEMYVSEPIQRQLPPDVNVGDYEAGTGDAVTMDEMDFYYG